MMTENEFAGGAGIPDRWERLWAPHRMAYLAGENRPKADNDVPCPFCTIPAKSDEEALIVARGKEVYAVLNLYPYTDEEKMYVKDACEVFRYKNNTGAGVIMCHKDMIDTWYNTYYKMLDRFMERDLFAGKDQSLINCICLIYTDMVKLIRPVNAPFDVWFYMLFYFSDVYYDHFRHMQ